MPILFWLIAIPVFAVCGAFAAVNPEPVALKLWPFEGSVSVPLYAAVLGPFFMGLLLAAGFTWLAHIPGRLARWRQGRRERALEEETARLKRALAEAELRAAGSPGTGREAARRLIAADSE